MKSLLTAGVSTLALIAGLASVQAADIQQRPVVKAASVMAPVFNLYLDLGDRNFSVTGTSNGFSTNLLRLGVNYRF